MSLARSDNVTLILLQPDDIGPVTQKSKVLINPFESIIQLDENAAGSPNPANTQEVLVLNTDQLWMRARDWVSTNIQRFLTSNTGMFGDIYQCWILHRRKQASGIQILKQGTPSEALQPVLSLLRAPKQSTILIPMGINTYNIINKPTQIWIPMPKHPPQLALPRAQTSPC